ncbi:MULTISPECIES: NADH-dependent oxidoreductase [unclassified Facklamia]|uniref:oxidoreductase n=1 Tax=Aerococcaceae TaxID=186827 RepID=UPI0013B67B5B|nr:MULTISPECIES: NADH-dependent oxidoreductase [unclassified Facklamia]NEW64600.1 NADH-dependent oxidoreductase [Facklamia sp. 252]NEW67925.1 NADH-dependent oxidoreductase [Facklamia sp. 253]QQD65413.1 NADH-dependent oxidoreductase [Aerococcaceae bacterium zg-252]
MKKLTDKITLRRGATLNSRIIQSPMLTNSGLDEKVTEDTLKYYGARSQSAGMVIVEYTSVSLNGGPSRSWAKDREQLAIYNDSFIEGHVELAKNLKKDGNKAILQLVHSGREAQYRHVLGGRVEVPSVLDFPWIDYPLHELTENEVWQIVKDFGSATKRAIEAGYDGVEIHGANHYLHQEFFSAFSNKRTDYWGGSLEKRMNFAIEVAREVFKVANDLAPKNFIIGYRISPEEIHGENIGYTWHESTQLIGKLTELFEFDYIHLSTNDYTKTPADSDKNFAELFQPSVKEPALLMIAGNILTYEKMNDALNYVDLVSLGRATLIDPQIAYKLSNGKEDEIYTEFNEESVNNAHLTPGLIDLLANAEYFGVPGIKYLQTLTTTKLDDVVTHDGTQ